MRQGPLLYKNTLHNATTSNFQNSTFKVNKQQSEEKKNKGKSQTENAGAVSPSSPLRSKDSDNT